VANTEPKIMAMVERMLAKNPDVSVGALFDKAKGMDSSIRRLSRRQFHARYPLQVKRRLGRALKAAGGKVTAKKTTARKAVAKKAGRAKRAVATAAAAVAAPAAKTARRVAPKRRRARRAPAAVAAAPVAAASTGLNRDAVRSEFMRFAAELAGAEDRKSVVKVLAGIERYVDRVVASSN